MPLKLYCQNPSCSMPTEYTLVKPKFCSVCGTKFGGQTSIASQPISPSRRPIVLPIAPSHNEEEVDVVIPEKLDVDVEIFGQDNGIKLGELAQQSKTGLQKNKGKKINKKAAIAAFRDEAGANGRKVIEIGDNSIDN